MKIMWISYEITFGWRLRQSLTNSIILRPNPMIWCPHAEIPLGWRLVVFQPSGTRSWDLAAIWWNFNEIHTIFIPRWGLSHKISPLLFQSRPQKCWGAEMDYLPGMSMVIFALMSWLDPRCSRQRRPSVYLCQRHAWPTLHCSRVTCWSRYSWI